MVKAAKNDSLDGEACPISEMKLTKGLPGKPVSFDCFRCAVPKTGACYAQWPTSDGVKTVCQGCAGLLHQMTVKGEDGAAKAAAPKKKKEEPAGPDDVCDECRQQNILFSAGVGHAACVEAWVNAGADVEFGGRKKIERPLHKACGNGHLEAASMLLDRGASMDARDKAQRTPLYRAAENSKDDVVAMLLEKGADATLTVGATTPLQAAQASLKKKRRKSIKVEDQPMEAAKAIKRKRTVELLQDVIGAAPRVPEAAQKKKAKAQPGDAPASKKAKKDADPVASAAKAAVEKPKAAAKKAPADKKKA
ncbi:ankyrin repeat-containing domain protein [Pelagophyceae sp. CCMP2097]|nr:ankyrin repeat-containing domain protein [Pelagophyceae sp. CCMP2097]